MKRYTIMGLAAVILGCSVLPSTASNGTGSAGAVVANADGRGSDTGSRSGRDGLNSGRCDHHRRHNNNNNNFISGDYDTYWGLPPWTRYNYYTPWQSDIDDGTAYKKIPTSHAYLRYGIPADYPGATGYTGPNPYLDFSQTNTSGMYQPPQLQMNPVPQINPAPDVNQTPTDVDLVVGVQRELRRRGFYRGIVNGISDTATRSAIRSFESSMRLPVTGVIGMPLLRALGFF